MGKRWKKLWKPHPFSKINLIKYNENLDIYGFQSKDNSKKCLEAFIRQGVPCLKHSAWYLTQWKIRESY